MSDGARVPVPTPTAGLDAENARLQERIDWLFDTLLIEHFGCGFDMYVRAPVPGWFLDELAQRTGLTVARLSAILLDLELAGWALQTHGRWQRSPKPPSTTASFDAG